MLAVEFLGFSAFLIGLILLEFTLCVIASEREAPGFAATCIIAGIAGYWFVTGSHPFTWIAAHPVLTASLFATYWGIGVLWSFYKWNLFCKNEADHIQRTENRPARVNEQPLVSENKYRFTSWIILWWASAFWYVFSDLLVDLRDWLLSMFSGVYARIAAKHFTAPALTEEERLDKVFGKK